MLAFGKGFKKLYDNINVKMLSQVQWCKAVVSWLLRRLRREDCLRPGVRLECVEAMTNYCIPAWATQQDPFS
uniref:Uncharacterized protein n=1 Tax=Cercocebus atys TaxID=9531 RepID=A0A2K5KZ60_CERAT